MNTTDATGLHAANFIDCVRTRNKPAAEVEIGHRSTTVGAEPSCHGPGCGVPAEPPTGPR